MTHIVPSSKPVIVTEIEDFLPEFKNVQMDIQLAGNLVSLAVGAGILQAPIAGWLQGVIAAAGALAVAFLSKPATAKVARRAAARAQRKAAARAAKKTLTVD